MTQQQQDLSNILERIQKLKALAESTSFQAEAETAAAMIQKLLLKYNLDMATVEAHMPEFERSPVVEQFESYGSKSEDWITTLHHTVAKYNFCRVVRHPYNNTFSIIGQPTNVEVVRGMAGELVTAARQASAAAYLAYQQDVRKEEEDRKAILELLGDRAQELDWRKHGDMLRTKEADRRAQFITSFFFGFINGLGERLYKDWQAGLENKQTQALVATHKQAVDNYIGEKYGHLVAGRQRSVSSQAGYNRGFTEGSRTPRTHQLTGG